MSLSFKELLAQFVQEEPALWDTRSNDYHLKTKRDDAWERVVNKFFARKIACDVEYCKATWGKMRDQYKKAHNRLTTGSEAPSNFQRQGIMALLQFLETTTQVPGTRYSNLGPTKSAAVDPASTNDAAVDDDIIIDENEPSQGTSFPRSPSPASLDNFSPSPTETASSMKPRTPLAPVDTGRRYLGKRKYPHTSKFDKATAIEAVHKASDAVREQLEEMKKPSDEFDDFGAYVAKRLRNLTKSLADEKMVLITQVFAYDDITFVTAKRPSQQSGIDQHYEVTEIDESQLTQGNLEYFACVPPKESAQQPYHSP